MSVIISMYDYCFTNKYITYCLEKKSKKETSSCQEGKKGSRSRT